MRHFVILSSAILSQILAAICFVTAWEQATRYDSDEAGVVGFLMGCVFVLNPVVGLVTQIDRTHEIPDSFYYLSFALSFVLWVLVGYLIYWMATGLRKPLPSGK